MNIPLVWRIKQPGFWVFVTIFSYAHQSRHQNMSLLSLLVNALASLHMFELPSAAKNIHIYLVYLLQFVLFIHWLNLSMLPTFSWKSLSDSLQPVLSVSSMSFYISWFHCQIIWHFIKLASIFHQITSDYRYLVKFHILIDQCSGFVVCFPLIFFLSKSPFALSMLAIYYI